MPRKSAQPSAIDAGGVIRQCRAIVAEQGLVEPPSFLDLADLVRDVVKDWPEERKATDSVKEFAYGLRVMRDDFETIVAADPMCLYRPAHQASLEFHQSNARTKYYRAPNRASKTQSAVAECYWAVTEQNPYHQGPPLPVQVAVVVHNFAKSMSSVFLPKYVRGEGGNPLSPVFPEGGKWFNHWNDLKKILTVACRECALAGKGKSCKHSRSTIMFFSAQEDLVAFAGGQYGIVHLDEQIPSGFFTEGIQRIKTVPRSCIIVTETPLGGKGFWTHKILTRDANARKRIEGSDRLLVSLHTCTQYETGLYPKEEIDADREQMTEQQAEARIFGRPAAFSESSVFDNAQISAMLNEVREPERGTLRVLGEMVGETMAGAENRDGSNTEDALINATEKTQMELCPSDDGELRVWERPKKYGQYVIGADVAEGMTNNDASCAQVCLMEREGHTMKLTHVASWHGWINSLAYASELFKLSLWYNQATIIPERRGPGDATVQRLKELNCWTLFRDTSDPSSAIFQTDTRFGLDTNVSTKSVFIATLQQVIWSKRTHKSYLVSWDQDTLDELGSYGQELTQSGLSYRFRGESGTPDDRVMGMALAAYGAVAGDVYDILAEHEAKRAREAEAAGLSPHDAAIWRGVRDQDAAIEELKNAQ